MCTQNLYLPSMVLPFAAGVGRDPEFEMEQIFCFFSLYRVKKVRMKRARKNAKGLPPWFR